MLAVRELAVLVGVTNTCALAANAITRPATADPAPANHKAVFLSILVSVFGYDLYWLYYIILAYDLVKELQNDVCAEKQKEIVISYGLKIGVEYNVHYFLKPIFIKSFSLKKSENIPPIKK
jgi:hypothetical protein